MRLMTGCILAVGLAAGPLAAQERRIEEVDLPRGVADEIIEFFNDPLTIRFNGRSEVPEGGRIVGNVGVLGGSFRVAGEIEGDLIVVNGDLTVPEGGRVTGDVIVVGGSAYADPAAIGGQLAVFSESLSYRRRGDRVEVDERRWDRWLDRERRRGVWLSVRAEGNYNRVEGLPVMFGPVFASEDPNRFRAEALAIWRSDAGLRLDDEAMGYLIRIEQHFGQEGRLSVGATAHSLVEPIERWGLRDIEASLAAFLFHRDYRDYYEREGFSAFLRWDDPEGGIRLGLSYEDEDHLYAPVGSPWTLKRNDAPWRPQPLVGEGRLRSIATEAIIDRRNDSEDPTDGWYLATRTRFGVGGGLTLPGYSAPDPEPPTQVAEPLDLGHAFRSGFLDLRRHTRMGPRSDLHLRGILAGSLDGDPLPPQMQHALGGEGSLPGYRPFSIDCGARSRPFSVFRGGDEGAERVPAFSSYGCDRIALFQAEYRGDLSFDIDIGPDDEWDDEWDWYPVIDLTPRWAVFFDAGRGWSLADEGVDGAFLADTRTFMDVGVGLFIGDVGLYWARPLNGDDKGVNFFLRIDHRF